MPRDFPSLHLHSASRFHNRFWIKFYPGSFSFLKPFYRGCCTESHLLRQFNTSNATPIFALRIGFGTSTDSTVTNHDNCWKCPQYIRRNPICHDLVVSYGVFFSQSLQQFIRQLRVHKNRSCERQLASGFFSFSSSEFGLVWESE